jgi:hypothetical protein
MALDNRELVDRHRDGMDRGDPLEPAQATDLILTMDIAVERLKAFIK